MTFDERLAQLMEEAEVPKRLSPESIQRMLEEQMAKEVPGHVGLRMDKENGSPSKHRPAVRITSGKTPQRNKRGGVLAGRTAAALAACVAFAFGIMALEQVTQKPGGYIQTEGQGQIIAATDYADVYKAIQNVFINNGSVVAGSGAATSPPPQTAGTGEMIGGEETSGETTVTEAPAVSVESGTGSLGSSSAPGQQITPEVKGSFLNSDLSQPGVLTPQSAITVQELGLTLYLSNGIVHAVSHNSGTPELVARIPGTEGTAREIFVSGNRLVVVSDNQLWIPYNTGTASSASQSATETTVSSGSDLADKGTASVSDTLTADMSEKSAVNPVVSESVSQDVSGSAGSGGEHTGDITSGTERDTAVTAAESQSQTVSAGAAGAVLQNNVVVEIYDLAGIAAGKPIKLGSYKQNGAYLSAHQSAEGLLYLVTDYAQYHTKPLERQEDLDNYVPSYYMNGEKYYIQAQDICLPADSNANGTASYTIVSTINPADEFLPMTSVKAVLGESKSVSVSEGGIYVAGPSYSSKNEASTSILRFTTTGGIAYADRVSLEGTLAVGESLRFQDGHLRIVTGTAKGYRVHLIGEDLKLQGSSENLCAGELVTDIRHTAEAVQVITDRAMVQVPVSEVLSGGSVKGSTLDANAITGSKIFGFGEALGVTVSAADGQFTVGVCNNSTFEILDSKTFKGTVAADGKGIFLDAERGLIGVPASDKGDFGTRNLYYLLSYSAEKGLENVGSGLLEYNDIGPGAAFQYAVAEGGADDGVIYIFSPTRVVAARLKDLKVISTIDL